MTDTKAAGQRFRALARASNAELEALMRSSPAPATDSLAGFEWRGANTGRLIRLLGLQKFIKGFFAVGGRVEGYNIPVAQNGLDAPWLAQPSADSPRRFAFYTVSAVRPNARDNLYRAALLLDYGASPLNVGTPVARIIRDYLVQPYVGDANILLGKAYLAIGPLRLRSNYFVLERMRPTTWVPPVTLLPAGR